MLKRTHDDLLSAWRVNTLAPEREFSYLRVDWDRPVDAARHIYLAQRVGKSPLEALPR